jgi:iron-sulfur cluster assembly protein
MTLILTETAAEEVKKIFEGQDIAEGTFLRLSIAGGGCSGMQYSLGLATDYEPSADTEDEHHGVRLVTKKKFALHLDGTTVDFQEGPMGRGFAIENPNYPKGGGCPGCGGGH